MELARYFVSPTADGWIVIFEGACLGVFPSRDAAVSAARDWAQFWCRSGHDGDVFVENADGELTQMPLSPAMPVKKPPVVAGKSLARLRRRLGTGAPSPLQGRTTPRPTATRTSRAP